MRCVTRHASFGLNRGMLINEWALLVGVTLNASCVCASGQSRLLELKTAMRIMAITALHRSFKYLVMERKFELVLRFRVAAETELWLVHLQQAQR